MTREEELKKLISDADKQYWDTGKGPVDDTTYDMWVEELRKMDPDAAWKVCSPKVYSEGKLRHPTPMLSMNKCYDLEEISKWANKYARGCTLLVMPKYDGIALVKYTNGIVGTRGDGKVGENATEVTHVFMDKEKPGLGEAIITHENFKQLKDLGYSHPRNAVSGILGSLDPVLQDRAKYISFARYNNPGMMLEITDFSVQSLQEAVESIKIIANNVPMDGIVFKIKDDKIFQKLGYTAHHWRGQIAYKFKKPGVPSVIREVFYQEKNGTITPMVRFDPVFCEGALLSKASCSNWAKVKAWDIRVGDMCEVERAGGVIPYLVSTQHTAESIKSPIIEPPTKCPTCGSELVVCGKRLYCPQCDQ